MSAAGDSDRTLVWPDGTVHTITRSTAETAGRKLEMDWTLPAGAWAPQPHVHPNLTEEYEVLAGLLEILVGREWRRLTPGERTSVPPGAVHTFRVGSAPTRVRNVLRPALDFEPYIKRLCRTANERELGNLRGIRALLYIAMLVSEYPKHSRAAGRPLNAAVRPLARLGRLLGLSPDPPIGSRREVKSCARQLAGGAGVAGVCDSGRRELVGACAEAF